MSSTAEAPLPMTESQGLFERQRDENSDRRERIGQHSGGGIVNEPSTTAPQDQRREHPALALALVSMA
jgi:hypothetical protein